MAQPQEGLPREGLDFSTAAVRHLAQRAAAARLLSSGGDAGSERAVARFGRMRLPLNAGAGPLGAAADTPELLQARVSRAWHAGCTAAAHNLRAETSTSRRAAPPRRRDDARQLR
jgi:hypothetical protein